MSGLSELRQRLERILRTLDPEVLEVDAAKRAVDDFAAIKNLAAAGEALAAKRVAASNAWRAEGDRSAAHWLARHTGASPGQASGLLETAERLAELPRLDDAFRAGRLSEAQAKEIASAAAAAPEAEAELLRVAEIDGLGGLKERCARVKAGAADNELQRHRQIHNKRNLRTWTDAAGAGHLHATGTPEDIARIKTGVEAFEAGIFKSARQQGRREPYDAYRFDALVAMADAALSGNGQGRAARPTFSCVVLVDLAALERGHTVLGETCEIAGVGPIPVAVAKELMEDAFLAAVITDGVDVYNVAHLGRGPSAHQWTALLARDRECVVPGCHQRVGLQAHHTGAGYAVTKRTKLDELALVCPFHHDQITYGGYRLEGRPGTWSWVPPDPECGYDAGTLVATSGAFP